MPKTYYDSELTGAQIDGALEAIHGVITPSNNGKVLYIDNGQIKAASASRWGQGAVLEPLSVTANGDYTPPTGTDGFDSVHVAVPSATLTTKSITQNGTYNASSDNADGYSSVIVNVSGGGSAVVQPLSVTENGTYNPPSGVDGYAPVTVNVNGDLPVGYTKALFIKSSGTQYINSGIVPDPNTIIEASVYVPEMGTATAFVVGVRENGENIVKSFDVRFSADNMYFGSGTEAILIHSISKNAVVACKRYINMYKLVDKATLYSGSWSNLDTGVVYTIPLYIFARNQNGTASVFGNLAIQYLRIWKNNSIVRDYVPCIRDSDNAVGLFDLVSQSFFGNDGTGTFTAVMM